LKPVAVLQFERPTVTDEVDLSNMGRANGLAARRSTSVRSTKHKLDCYLSVPL